MSTLSKQEDGLDYFLGTLQNNDNDSVLLRGLESFARQVFDGAIQESGDATFLVPLFAHAGALYHSNRRQCIPPWRGGPGPQYDREPLRKYLETQSDSLRALVRTGAYSDKRSIKMDEDCFVRQYRGLQSEEFDALVPVLHGGFLVGSYAAFLLQNDSITPIQLSRNEGRILRTFPGFNYDFTGKRLLVVDDVMSTAGTRNRIRAYLAEQRPASVRYLFGCVL